MITSLEWPSRRNFAWNISDSEGQKILGFSVWLPLAFRLANANAAVEIAIDTAKVVDEAALQPPDLGDDPVIAKMMALAPGQRREGLLANCDSAAKPFQPSQVSHRSAHVPRAPVEVQAPLALELAQVQKSAPPRAPGAQQPGQIPVSPRHFNRDTID